MELLPGSVPVALLQCSLIKTMCERQRPRAWQDSEPMRVMDLLLPCCQKKRYNSFTLDIHFSFLVYF